MAADPAEGGARHAVALGRHGEVPVTAELFDALEERDTLVDSLRLDRALATRTAEGSGESP